MTMRPNKIRCLALAIISRNGKTLVSPGYYEVKKSKFYRLIGGGIEFGEDALTALRREIKEELGLEIENCQFLETKENIFEFNGDKGHEICFVFRADLVSEEIYKQEVVQIIDEPDHQAIWLEINPENISRIKPEGFEEYFI